MMFQPNFLSHAFSFDSVFTYNNAKSSAVKPKNRTKQDSAFTYVKLPIELEESRSEREEESCCSKSLRRFIITISYIIAIIFFPLTMWFCVKKIRALERLVIFRLGKLQPVVGPGFCMVIPFVDHWKWVDLSSKLAILPGQQLLTVDGGIVEVLAEIKYCVGHVVHYVTRSHSQEQSVEDLGVCCLTNIISGKEQSDIEKTKEIIASHVKVELNKTLVNWGIQVLEVVIPTVKVLKEAEPVNPLNSILNVLRAVNPDSVNDIQKHLLPEPDLQDKKDGDDMKELHDQGKNSVAPEHVCIDSMLIKMKKYADEVMRKSSAKNIPEIYKFQVIDEPNDDKIVFLSFHEGIPVVFEEENASQKPDVIITLNLNVMEDLLNFKLSPVQAYVAGEIKVIGDLNSLKIFTVTV